jgi:bifunctional non-homologous end joining protein LigD
VRASARASLSLFLSKVIREAGIAVSKKLTKVDFTNLGKVLYPELRITNAQVIEYYVRVAPKILDLMIKRPLVLTRFPNGIVKEGFYEKNAPLGTPSWVETFKRYSETAQRNISYILCNDLDTLIWLANLAALEIHMTLSKMDSWDSPNLVLFDIDPEPPANFDDVIDVALLLKEKLNALGVRSYVKTSGKKGFTPLSPLLVVISFERHASSFIRLHSIWLRSLRLLSRSSHGQRSREQSL